jgi:hypothetical protein
MDLAPVLIEDDDDARATGNFKIAAQPLCRILCRVRSRR